MIRVPGLEKEMQAECLVVDMCWGNHSGCIPSVSVLWPRPFCEYTEQGGTVISLLPAGTHSEVLTVNGIGVLVALCLRALPRPYGQLHSCWLDDVSGKELEASRVA